MSKYRLLTAISLLVAITATPCALAQDSTGQSQSETPIQNTEVGSSQSKAAAWGLTDDEYQRYQSIMSGPRGVWSPNLDPLTALGLAARNDAERQRYAELLVEMERKRVEAELALQRAYDQAWKRLYPGAMPVKPFTSKDRQPSFFDETPANNQRLNVVVATEGCSQCDTTVKRLLNSGALMDIWVVDSDGNDNKIRHWARRLGIPQQQVRDGIITLNHGDALNVDRTELPRVAPRG